MEWLVGIVGAVMLSCASTDDGGDWMSRAFLIVGALFVLIALAVHEVKERAERRALLNTLTKKEDG